MFDSTFFARMRGTHPDTGNDLFQDIERHLFLVRLYGGTGPYFKIILNETEDNPEYFGWKNFEREEYNFIYYDRQLVEMCFAYGSNVEEDLGRGKVVGFSLENYVEVDSED